MSSKKKRRLGKEELQKIVELCGTVESKGLNPFIVDVDDLVTIIREYFPEWQKPDEMCLDAEALNNIATVVKLQSEWVKHRATSLYTDPFLIEEKIRTLSADDISGIFLESWHPIIEMEQLSIHSLDKSMKYWEGLPPLNERWKNIDFLEKETGTATREEMIQQRILSGEAFSERLQFLWQELRSKVGEDGKVRYWSFIRADTYQETIERAYLTSFLVTYGYATLEIYPLEEEMFIKPFEKPIPTPKDHQLISFPIPISYEEWTKWKEHQGA